MSTATVSASVDTTTKTLANAYIRKAGLTPNELIRRLWESIADTGVVPQFQETDDVRAQARMQAFRESQSIIKTLPHGTQLDTISYDDLREELSNRDI